MGIMSKPPAAALALLLLTACAGTPDAETPERLASLARQRIKLEDLTYCTGEVQDRAELAMDDPAFATAVDRCMAGLGYSRIESPPP